MKGRRGRDKRKNKMLRDKRESMRLAGEKMRIEVKESVNNSKIFSQVTVQ